MRDLTRELARLEALSIEQEVILDAHVETNIKMKEDPWYDEDDVRRHSWGGLQREKKFLKIAVYLLDYHLVMKWLMAKQSHFVVDIIWLQMDKEIYRFQ